MLAGDTLFVGNNHTESIAASTVYTFPGTPTSPNYVFAVDASKWTGSYVPVGADLKPYSSIVNITGASHTATINGSFLMYGPIFKTGSGQSTVCSILIAQAAGNQQQYHDCAVWNQSTSASSLVVFGSTTAANLAGVYVSFQDSSFKFGATTQSAQVNCPLFITGNPIQSILISGSSVPASLFSDSFAGAKSIYAFGTDFSSATGYCVANNVNAFNVEMIGCKTAFSGLISATPSSPNTVRVVHEGCGSAGNTYELHIADGGGTLDTDTSNFKNGGSTIDGNTGLSWKVTGTGNATQNAPFCCPPLFFRTDTVGVARTAMIDIMFDGSAGALNTTNLTDVQIYFDLQSYVHSGSSLCSSTFDTATASNATQHMGAVVAQLTGAALATQPTSTATWTTSGVTTPMMNSLTASFTPQAAGLFTIRIRVVLGSGQTVWIDPEVQVI